MLLLLVHLEAEQPPLKAERTLEHLLPYVNTHKVVLSGSHNKQGMSCLALPRRFASQNRTPYKR